MVSHFFDCFICAFCTETSPFNLRGFEAIKAPKTMGNKKRTGDQCRGLETLVVRTNER